MKEKQKEMMEVTVKVDNLTDILYEYGIIVNPFSGDLQETGFAELWIGFVGDEYIVISQTPSQSRKGTATMLIRKDIFKVIEKDLHVV